MWPDLVSNPGPLTYESGALPTALRGPAKQGSSYISDIGRYFVQIFWVQRDVLAGFH